MKVPQLYSFDTFNLKMLFFIKIKQGEHLVKSVLPYKLLYLVCLFDRHGANSSMSG